MLFNKASCRKRKHYGSTMLTDPDYWNALTDPDSRNVLTGPIYSGSLSAVEGPDFRHLLFIFYKRCIIRALCINQSYLTH